MDSLYREVARVLKRLEGKRGSLKSLTFASERTCSQKKKVYALASQTIKYKSLIFKVMDDCKISEKVPQLSFHLCMVLVYDILFGKGVQCGGMIKQAIYCHRKELKSALSQLNPAQCSLKREVNLPKYARVNRIKLTVEEAVYKLTSEGYCIVSRNDFIQMHSLCIGGKHHELSRHCVSPQEQKTCMHKSFCQDKDIENLLIFCPFATLTNSSTYTSSQLILQDKASCFPAFLLSPVQGSHVIDTCAAPGNKTSHLASIMNNMGTVHAFDKDPKRFRNLEEMMSKSSSTCVISHLKDFLEVNPDQYPEVSYILVDPSCSGSGIASRVEYSSEVRKVDRQRLNSLSSFQKRILKHALVFPNVKRVVYSTCSVHSEENEMVVEDAFRSFQSEYDLVHAFPEWTRRGDPSFVKGNSCIRTNTDDLTNGFFVAVFERRANKPSLEVYSGTEPEQPDIVPTVQDTKQPKKMRRTRKKRKTRHHPVTGR